MTRLAVLCLLLALVSPAWAATPTRCTTYEEKTLGRLQTLCADGTRAVSTWSPTLRQWTITVTASPQARTCTPHTTRGALEVRCR